MKKFTFCLLTTFIFLFIIPTEFKAEIDKKTSTAFIGLSNSIESGNVNAEINAKDLSRLNQSERNQYSSGKVDSNGSQQLSEGAAFSDGGGLIVFIMMVF